MDDKVPNKRRGGVVRKVEGVREKRSRINKALTSGERFSKEKNTEIDDGLIMY